jgi:hypothetical protein
MLADDRRVDHLEAGRARQHEVDPVVVVLGIVRARRRRPGEPGLRDLVGVDGTVGVDEPDLLEGQCRRPADGDRVAADGGGALSSRDAKAR